MSLTFRRWVIAVILLIEVGLFCFQLYLALWASEQSFPRIPEIDALARFLEPFWPALSGYTKQSQFPSITTAFYVISASLLPVQIGAFALFNYIAGSLPQAPRVSLRITFLALAALITLCSSLLLLPNDFSLIGSLGPSSSRFGLAFFGLGQFVFVWLIAGLLVGELLIFMGEQFAE
jgi:hypothetical protein